MWQVYWLRISLTQTETVNNVEKGKLNLYFEVSIALNCFWSGFMWN